MVVGMDRVGLEVRYNDAMHVFVRLLKWSSRCEGSCHVPLLSCGAVLCCAPDENQHTNVQAAQTPCVDEGEKTNSRRAQLNAAISSSLISITFSVS